MSEGGLAIMEGLNKYKLGGLQEFALWLRVLRT